MAREWKENTSSGPRLIGGKLLQPGEGTFVDVGPFDQPTPPIDALTSAEVSKVRGADDAGVLALSAGEVSALQALLSGSLGLADATYAGTDPADPCTGFDVGPVHYDLTLTPNTSIAVDRDSVPWVVIALDAHGRMTDVAAA